MWQALVGSGRLGSGCLVLRADTRENPGGKNRVMTEEKSAPEQNNLDNSTPKYVHDPRLQ